jgi:hypothetical protein
MPRGPKKRSHTEAALSIYGQCFQIRKKPSSRPYWCPLHNKQFNFANVVVGETVRVIQCKIVDDRCYNESNMVVVEKENCFGENSLTTKRHLPVDCIDVNKPLGQYPHHAFDPNFDLKKTVTGF